MDFRCTSPEIREALDSWSGDTLAIGLHTADDQGVPHPWHDKLATCLGTELLDQIRERGFKGKPGECRSFERLQGHPRSLIAIGLGDAETFDLTALRSASAAAATAAAQLKSSHLALAFPCSALDAASAAVAMAEAVRLSLYQDQRFRSEPEPSSLPETVHLLGLAEGAAPGLGGVDARCAGVELARRLVAAPPNVATPRHLADTAAELAERFGLDLKVLERPDCEALGMGAYLGVAQGSDLPPQFIHLTYTPSGTVERRVALVGKGLTFDSGGYNLKTAGSQIEMMKYDMGGSAAVLGAARTIGEIRPPGWKST